MLLDWAAPLLPESAVWDKRAVSEAVLAVPGSPSLQAVLQERQLERKKRRKQQAMEQAEAASQGRKSLPLTSPTAAAAITSPSSSSSLPIPYDIASKLLAQDKALSAMRLQWVPSRVGEDTFFVSYFNAVVQAVSSTAPAPEPAAAAAQQTMYDRTRAIDARSGKAE